MSEDQNREEKPNSAFDKIVRGFAIFIGLAFVLIVAFFGIVLGACLLGGGR